MIAGHFGVNPQTRIIYNKLKFYVVQALSTADGSGNMTITLGEQGIVPSGQFQNVAASPVNGNALTVTSGTSGQTSRQSLLLDSNAITFACVPLASVPAGMGAKSEVANDEMSGISISYKTWYDGETNMVKSRFDVLAAWALTYPELAVRLQG